MFPTCGSARRNARAPSRRTKAPLHAASEKQIRAARSPKVKSATFKYPQGFGQIGSGVDVQPSDALALANFRASLRPRLLTCLRNMLPAVLAGKAGRTLSPAPSAWRDCRG